VGDELIFSFTKTMGCGVGCDVFDAFPSSNFQDASSTTKTVPEGPPIKMTRILNTLSNISAVNENGTLNVFQLLGSQIIVVSRRYI
jgi:hypothetical protein